jgi:hypothetical protein
VSDCRRSGSGFLAAAHMALCAREPPSLLGGFCSFTRTLCPYPNRLSAFKEGWVFEIVQHWQLGVLM